MAQKLLSPCRCCYITLYSIILLLCCSLLVNPLFYMQLLQTHVVQQHSGALPSPNRAITLYYTQQQCSQHLYLFYIREYTSLSLHLNVNTLYRDALFVSFFPRLVLEYQMIQRYIYLSIILFPTIY